jgi:hypothetical protein
VIQFAPALDGGTITLAGDFINPFASNVGATAFQIRNNTTITIDGVTGMSQGVNIARSGAAFRFFYVDVGSNLALKGLTLTNGLAQGLPGGNSALSGAGGSYQSDLTGRGGGGGGAGLDPSIVGGTAATARSAPNAVKANGDADNDSDVDAADLAVWKTQFGSAPPVVAAAVFAQAPALTAAATFAAATPTTTLSSQLVDAAMATQFELRSPALRRNASWTEALRRRHHAIARPAATLPKVASSFGLIDFRMANAQLHDAEANHGVQREETAAEPASVDKWLAKRDDKECAGRLA